MFRTSDELQHLMGQDTVEEAFVDDDNFLRSLPRHSCSVFAGIFSDSDNKQQPWRNCGCEHTMWKQRPIHCGPYIVLIKAGPQLQFGGLPESAKVRSEEEGCRAGPEGRLPHQGMPDCLKFLLSSTFWATCTWARGARPHYTVFRLPHLVV